MSTDAKNMAKLKAARLTPAAYTTNFTERNLDRIKARVSSREFLTAEPPTNLYLYAASADRHNVARSTMAAALVAKALALQNKKVIYCRLAALLREIRCSEMEREARSFHPILQHLGHGGYVVMGDMLEYADVEDKYGYHAMHVVTDLLMTHVEEGGGLVIGATHIEPREVTGLGTEFQEFIAQRFESFCIA